jgi:hypothetical protein
VGEAAVREALMSEALGGAGAAGTVIPLLALLLGDLVPMVLGFLIVRSDATLPIVMIVIVSVAIGIVAMFVAIAQMSKARRRRLFSIGRGFDPRGYLEALGAKRKYGVLVLRIRFATPWPDDARVPTSSSVEQSAWDGDALELRGADLVGTERLERGPVSRIFNNKLFHAAFLRVIGELVPRLERIAPIASIDATIEGDTQPWNAKATA